MKSKTQKVKKIKSSLPRIVRRRLYYAKGLKIFVKEWFKRFVKKCKTEREAKRSAAKLNTDTGDLR